MGKHRSWVAHRRPVRRPAIASMGVYKGKRLAPAWRAAGRGRLVRAFCGARMLAVGPQPHHA